MVSLGMVRVPLRQGGSAAEAWREVPLGHSNVADKACVELSRGDYRCGIVRARSEAWQGYREHARKRTEDADGARRVVPKCTESTS